MAEMCPEVKRAENTESPVAHSFFVATLPRAVQEIQFLRSYYGRSYIFTPSYREATVSSPGKINSQYWL